VFAGVDGTLAVAHVELDPNCVQATGRASRARTVRVQAKGFSTVEVRSSCDTWEVSQGLQGIKEALASDKSLAAHQPQHASHS
jgi:hypothetical protein